MLIIIKNRIFKVETVSYSVGGNCIDALVSAVNIVYIYCK